MKNLAVVDVNQVVLFQGTREDCCDYMRNNAGWNDLRYINDGRLGRYSSWIL